MACTRLLQHVAKGRNYLNRFIQLHESLSHIVTSNQQSTPGPSSTTLPDDALFENHLNEAMMDANASFDVHAFENVMVRIPNILDEDMDYTIFQG